MKLTIIIPLYNQEKLILRTLDSIREGFDIETIVIDDGSTDNSFNVVLDYINNHPKKNIVLLYNENNSGVGVTINKGLDNATGEYIVIMCSDDYFIEPVDSIINEIDGTDLIYYDLRINNGDVWKSKLTPKWELGGSRKIMRREFIGDLRRSEKRLGGDYDFYIELLKKNPTEKFTDIVLYHYNFPRKGSLIEEMNNKDENI